ncbi:MAG: BMP family ABC transporter substrate-binding protein [Acholeplasmataceae bacterium]
MKKFFALLILLVAGFVLVGCGGQEYKIAMITDSGDIDDRSFNQTTWEGIIAYGEENDVTHKYYKPTEISYNAYVAAIDLAVKNGAEIVVTPGYFFEQAIHFVQTKYPDIKFLLIDGSPNNVMDWDTMETYDGSDPDFTIGANTLSVIYQEEQSGFLAGYATIKDGHDNLGFFGGIKVPAVQRFGIGWIAGAYLAADELGVDLTFTADHYEYLNTFEASDASKNKATTWFNSGVDVLFSAAGGAGNSAMTAASTLTNKWVVGVDVDQSSQSEYVLTSATKALARTVQETLDAFYSDAWVGGISKTSGAEDLGIELPTNEDAWRFTSFTVAQYEALFDELVEGTIVVPKTGAELETFLANLGITNADLIAKV